MGKPRASGSAWIQQAPAAAGRLKSRTRKPRSEQVNYGSQVARRKAPAKEQSRGEPIKRAPAQDHRRRLRPCEGRGQRGSSESKSSARLGARRKSVQITLFTFYLLHTLGGLLAREPSTSASPSAHQPTEAPARFEEEVDLQSGRAGNKTRRRPRVYRIAAKINGQLQLPVHRLPPRLAPLSASEPTATTGASEELMASFGKRAPARAPSTPAPNTRPTEPCPSAAPVEQAASSIAASSPMLRLTSSALANRTLGQLVSAGSELHQPLGVAAVSSVEDAGEREELPAAAQSLRNAGTIAWAPASAQIEAVTSDSILSLIEEFDSRIITNRTEAQLSCDSGEMILRLNFTEPFKGIVYPDHNRVSACRFFGDGHHNYELRLPLRGCGTRQAAPRVFVNDVIVRFHKTLELEEDEVKTLICRYPPPLAQSGVGEHSLSSRPSYNSSSPRVSAGSSFELLDLPSGAHERPPNVESLETLSENLAVAPTSAGKGSHLSMVDFRQRFGQPAGLDQRGNLVLAGSGDSQVQRQQSGGFFERLSSVELLFMISSLMFLVLLALGLAASYLCFKRQSRRRSVDQRASAILRRKRHYPTSPVPPTSYRAGRAMPEAMQHGRYLNPGGPGYLGASLAPSSSSPESELSHTGLLANPNSQAYFYTNRAFAPDLGDQNHKQQTYMAPLGRRETNHYGFYGQSTMGRSHRHLVPERAPPPTPAPVKQRHLVNRPLHYGLVRGPAKRQVQEQVHYGAYQPHSARTILDGTQSLWRAKSMGTNAGKHLLRGSHRLEAGSSINRRTDRERVWRAEPNNNHHKADVPIQHRHRTPKLYLKSIEDSYITNFTEIKEQEYMKRDTTRPLGMTEWRKFSMNPVDKRQERARSASSTSSLASSADQSERHLFTSAGQTNLRSLTELDVNFARSLLRPQRVAGATTTPAGIRSARSLDRLEPEASQAEARERSNSDPEVAQARARPASSSPDLILSPEYEHGRLELEEAACSSHNTVSYV